MQAGADAVDLLAGLQAERGSDAAAPGGARSRAERHSTTPELVHADAPTCARGLPLPASPKLFPVFRPKTARKVLLQLSATACFAPGVAHIGGGSCAESSQADYAFHLFRRYGIGIASQDSSPVASQLFAQVEARQLSSLRGTRI